MGVSPACMSTCYMHAWHPQRSEHTRFSGTGVTDGWELLHGCWESKPGPLEAQPVFCQLELHGGNDNILGSIVSTDSQVRDSVSRIASFLPGWSKFKDVKGPKEVKLG